MAELNLHWGARGEDNLCDVISIILPLPPSGFVKGFKTVASDRCVKPPPTSFGPECLDPRMQRCDVTATCWVARAVMDAWGGRQTPTIRCFRILSED